MQGERREGAFAAVSCVLRRVVDGVDEEQELFVAQSSSQCGDGLAEPRAESSHNEKPGCTAWLVRPTTDARLDDTDPLAAHSVVRRPRFTKNVNALGSLRPTDVFQRAWTNAGGKLAARSEAWGRNAEHEEGESKSGERLVCTADFLQTALAAKKQDLLILVILRLYEKGFGNRESQFWHSTAVLHVRQSLDFDFFAGSHNQLHVSTY